jgi:uncharacterized protein (DUF1810 family)
LNECAQALMAIDGKSADEVLGFPDNMKLRSSMTLFMTAAGRESIYEQVLDKYFAGARDPETARRLGSSQKEEG